LRWKNDFVISSWGQMKKYRIAAIQGDGIGKEVLPEGIRVIDAAAG
jgi:isocitrate dehydrogenase